MDEKLFSFDQFSYSSISLSLLPYTHVFTRNLLFSLKIKQKYINSPFLVRLSFLLFLNSSLSHHLHEDFKYPSFDVQHDFSSFPFPEKKLCCIITAVKMCSSSIINIIIIIKIVRNYHNISPSSFSLSLSHPLLHTVLLLYSKTMSIQVLLSLHNFPPSPRWKKNHHHQGSIDEGWIKDESIDWIII